MISRTGVAPADPSDLTYRRNLRPEVFALLPPLKSGLRTLEIGCGEGAFCQHFAEDSEMWGIEPDHAAAEVAGRVMHRVFADTFEPVSDQLPLGYFDLVICNDVIEHMTDHEGFLRAIQRHMAPGSMLVASLPNVRFIDNLFNLVVLGDWHYQPSGILDRTHMRFFTFRSARRCFGEAGFTLARFEGINKLPLSLRGLRNIALQLFGFGLLILSGGSARDTQYLQIGLVALPRVA